MNNAKRIKQSMKTNGLLNRKKNSNSDIDNIHKCLLF